MSTTISTYVNASADIVRVVSLKQGDVYKRLDEGYGAPSMTYGVVTSVLNNGERTAITALEYVADYSGVTAKAKVLTDKTEVAIFPATPDEIAAHVSDLLAAAKRGVQAAESTLHEKREALKQAHRVAEMFEGKTLTAPVVDTGVDPEQVTA